MNEKLECIDCHQTQGVSMCSTPDRRDSKTFPRCDECYEKRLESARRTMDRYPEAFTGGDPFSGDDYY